MKLAKIQKIISSEIYGQSKDSQMANSLFVETNPTSIDAGIKTYKNNLYYGIADALRETFPVVDELLTPTNFNYFSRKYLLEGKSLHFDIGKLSQGFARFLKNQPELESSPWLYDLANFEYAWEQLELGFGQLQHPKINPTVTLLEMEYQILNVWSQRQQFFDNDESPLEEKHFLILWSHENTNHCEPLHPQIALAFIAMSHPENLTNSIDVLEKSLQICTSEAQEILAFLESKKWLS